MNGSYQEENIIFICRKRMEKKKRTKPVTLEDFDDWSSWNASDTDMRAKVLTYYPGRTLNPHARKGLKMRAATRIVLLGKRGHGKSAFIDTLDHIINRVQFQQFLRQGKSDDSFTFPLRSREVLSESVILGQGKIEVLDTAGLANFRGSSVSVVDKELAAEDEAGFFDSVARFFQGSEVFLDVDATIVVWRGDLPIDEISGMQELVSCLRKITQKPPIVLVTFAEKIEEAHGSEGKMQIQSLIEGKLQGTSVFITNYTKASTQDNPETNHEALRALLLALAQADATRKLLYDSRKGGTCTCQ